MARRLQREEGKAAGAAGRRVEASATQNAGGRPLHGAGDTAQRRRQRETEERSWRWKKGLFCNFQKFQGLNCNLAVTFKPELK